MKYPLLWIGGALAVGYYLAKRSNSAPGASTQAQGLTAAPTVAAAAAPQVVAPDGTPVAIVQPDYEVVDYGPAWVGYGWGPGWGMMGRGGGGGHGHGGHGHGGHGGGHH